MFLRCIIDLIGIFNALYKGVFFMGRFMLSELRENDGIHFIGIGGFLLFF